MRRIHEEGLTFDSFVLLNEEDLRELGLKMGERKLLMSWIKSSVNSQSSTECSSTMNPTSVSTPAAIMLPLPARDVVVVESQVYAIEELLCNYTKGGTKIVENLKQGIYYTRSERVLMIKVLGKYLMKNCLIQNDPSSKEMTNLAKSIVMEFPVLFSKTTPNGYRSTVQRVPLVTLPNMCGKNVTETHLLKSIGLGEKIVFFFRVNLSVTFLLPKCVCNTFLNFLELPLLILYQTLMMMSVVFKKVDQRRLTYLS
nr:uncharacterized protein LOC124807164 isoform X2 [Hydra vulgaris]